MNRYEYDLGLKSRVENTFGLDAEQFDPNNDLVEQFRNKKNIAALNDALKKQIADLVKFFVQLQAERTLQTAVGKQLDMIGDIAVLSRMEAGKLLGEMSPIEVISDEDYRHCLRYKILKNTCDCTYYDIMKVIDMFWDGHQQIRYSEDIDKPATIILDFDAFRDTVLKILKIPFIRAGGVGILFRMHKNDNLNIYYGVARQQTIKRTVDCDEGVIVERTYLTDEDGNILTDEDNNWLTQ